MILAKWLLRATTLLVLTSVSACSSLSNNPFKDKSAIMPQSGAVDATYAGQATQYAVQNAIAAPRQCFAPEHQTGAPVMFNRESIIDQPVLIKREPQKVPSHPTANRNFYCAAFAYAVDERGRVTDISTLYNSHPGLAGIDFARAAKKTLKQWRYEPGQVDKAPAKFTGLSTVFYYSFEG